MSKYNSGDKFVIEVDKAFGFMGGDPLYTIKGFNALVFDDYGLDKLQKLNPKLKIEDIDDMLAEHDLKKEAYYKGLNDAWELARKIVLDVSRGGISEKDIESIFGEKWTISNIFKNFTPQEALAKIEAYEESKAIKVGDVVKVKTGAGSEHLGVVTQITANQNCACIVYADGSTEMNTANNMTKTNKHLDIEHLLEQIRGNE